jgi:osmoprotectant transport system ATP-binding protein
MPGEAPLVEFDTVAFAYQSGQDVLSGLTLRIARGQVVALVGASGSGKSTALKLANRLLLPQRGIVSIEGRDTRDWDPIALRRRTGYVLQEIGLFPHLTIEENVQIVPRLEGWPPARRRERSRALLALVGLSADLATRWPRELSGGQRQRVGVARALAAEPPLLLMDEPFGALDPITRVELRREFRRLQQSLRQTVLLVTHDISEAVELGDLVGVLHAGRLVAYGPPAELGQSTSSDVRQLFDAGATPVVRFRN